MGNEIQSTVAVRTNDRVYWVDWIKVFAMTLVVYAHTDSFSVINRAIFTFHMPLFFMISGYLHKTRTFREELPIVFKSLVIPYIILLFGLCILHLDTNYRDYLNILIGSLEGAPLYVRPMWFVVCLVLIRILLSFFRANSQLICLAVISLLGYYALVRLQMVPHDFDFLQINTTLMCLPFFILGIFLKKHFETVLKFKWAIYVLAIPCLLLAIKNGYINVFRCEGGTYVSLFYINAAMISLFWILLFSQFLNKRNLHVEKLAKGMIILLATHFTMIDLFALVLPLTIPMTFVVAILVMIIGYFLSVFSYVHFPILFGKYDFRRKLGK